MKKFSFASCEPPYYSHFGEQKHSTWESPTLVIKKDFF